MRLSKLITAEVYGFGVRFYANDGTRSPHVTFDWFCNILGVDPADVTHRPSLPLGILDRSGDLCLSESFTIDEAIAFVDAMQNFIDSIVSQKVDVVDWAESFNSGELVSPE